MKVEGMMAHKIQVRFLHHHLSGQSGIKGVEMALPVGYLQKCIFIFPHMKEKPSRANM